MKILITGANGYIASRLIPVLLEKEHELFLLVRDPNRLHLKDPSAKGVNIIQGDLLNKKSLESIPKDIDAAYYLIHSMNQGKEDFAKLDKEAAENFIHVIDKTSCKQIIYLTGIQDPKSPSKHLKSRLEVEQTLQKGKCPVTVLRAAIIVGAGSASFEIMRDLVEKLPIMVAPKWVNSVCQPIAIRDVLYYLEGVLDHKECIGKVFDIGGPDILPYQQMLLQMSDVRKLKRFIIKVPVLTPRLSSYWLILITATNYFLAKTLVDSLKNDVVCKNHDIQTILPRKCLHFKDAIAKAFDRIEEHGVISSWKDSVSSGRMPANFLEHVEAPIKGSYRMICKENFTIAPEKVYECFTQIGGKNGWYYMTWAWKIRGAFDKLFGGIGLRRGRVSRKEIRIGDALDFWRVLLIDPEKYRLLLYAEMKLPGEAWLEFAVKTQNGKSELIQSAIFRPKGLLGRLYWAVLYPIHVILLKGLAKQIVIRASIS